MGAHLRSLSASQQNIRFKDLPQRSQTALSTELDRMKAASDRMQETIHDILRPNGRGKPSLTKVRSLLTESGIPLYRLVREQVPTATLLAASHNDDRMMVLTRLVSATTTLVSTAAMAFEGSVQDLHDEVSGLAARFSSRR